MKMVLLIACVGHVLCGICDCLLGYSPSGRLDLKSALKDPVKMRTTFEDMPLKWPLISIILGVYLCDYGIWFWIFGIKQVDGGLF